MVPDLLGEVPASDSFARWVAAPARNARRSWRYRRRWAAVMTIAGLTPLYQGRIVPVLGKVRSTRYVDRVRVRLVSGQSAAEFAEPVPDQRCRAAFAGHNVPLAEARLALRAGRLTLCRAGRIRAGDRAGHPGGKPSARSRPS